MITFKKYLTELDHLAAILTKKGDKLVRALLNGKVTVNFKIDTSAFVVANEGGELKFYGREGKIELDKIKRAGSNIWEPFIAHIEKQNWDKIPSGVQVFCEMFNDQIPTLVQYAVKPKNGLIVSYCKKNGKIVPPNDRLNKQMADLLQISPPPVMHEGKFSKVQKEKMMHFLHNPEEHQGEDFTKFVLSLFLPPKAMKYLVGKVMEGLVFYFDDGTMAKVVDKGFTQKITAKNNAEDKVTEYYTAVSDIAYNNLKKAYMSIMKNKKSVAKIEAEKKKEDKYIRLASAITGSIVATMARDMKKFDGLKKEVDAKRFSVVTKSLLPKGLNTVINKYWWAEDVFRILLYGLRKEKKRINIRTGLTTDRKNIINDMVKELKLKDIL